MRRVRLGQTELMVSPIGLGTWQLSGDWGGLDKQVATRAILRARELGVNLFDTAQAYGFGTSESLLGSALDDELRRDREAIVLATKGGLRLDDGRFIRDAARSSLRSGIESSLRALNVDYVDVYQVHWPDPNTPMDVVAETLQQLVDEGKARHVGVSNFSRTEMSEFARTRPVETLQPPYNLLHRDPEADTLPYCVEHDIGVLSYGPLAHGLLTGAFSEGTTMRHDDWRRESPIFQRDALARNVSAVRTLGRFAGERGHSVSQVAIAWVLTNPAVHVAIVGARTPEHITQSAAAADIRLDSSDLAEIEQMVAGAKQAQVPSPDG